jgi:hypothetical protein
MRQVVAQRKPAPELLSFLMPYPETVAAMALALRDLVLQEAPDANEVISRGYAVSIAFTFTERWMDAFCYVAVYKAHVNLGFNRGAQLPGAEGVLEGTGKLMRHLPVRAPADLDNPNLRRFLRAALKIVDRPAEKSAQPKTIVAGQQRV